MQLNLSLNLFEIGVLAFLAGYRLTLMLHEELGPGHIFAKLRTRLGVRYDAFSNPVSTNWISEGVLCFYCLSVWVSAGIVAILVIGAFLHVLEAFLIILSPFALSGAAVYLRKMGG